MRRFTVLLAPIVLTVAACDVFTSPSPTVVFELHSVDGEPLPYIISSGDDREWRLVSMRYEFTGQRYEMFARTETEMEDGVSVWEIEGDGAASISGDTIRLEFGETGWLAEPRKAILTGDTLRGKLAHKHDAVFVRR